MKQNNGFWHRTFDNCLKHVPSVNIHLAIIRRLVSVASFIPGKGGSKVNIYLTITSFLRE